jgi:pyruvate/2-oxoacid:ferredoxin oxidoreductase alpha subunit
MIDKDFVISYANEAMANLAYKLSELIAIYPITPSSPMAEFSDEWSIAGKKIFLAKSPSFRNLSPRAVWQVHFMVRCNVEFYQPHLLHLRVCC